MRTSPPTSLQLRRRGRAVGLHLVPCSVKDAEAFIEQHHRHHRPPQKRRFAVAVAIDGEVVGVAIISDPVARELDDGWTAEVSRVCVSARRVVALPLWRCLGLAGATWLLGYAPAAAVVLAFAGVQNACSMLYGAAWRAARALGYQRCGTYTLPSEGGESLKAAGWRCLGEAGGGSWSCPSRPRVDHHPTQVKLRWEVSV